MEYNNNEGMLREEQKSSGGLIWWIIGILIVLGLLWFFFGQSGDIEIIDEVDAPTEQNEGMGEDMEFDENGLPLAGPLAPISNIEIEVTESFPVQVALLVSGDLPNGCTYLNTPAQVRSGNAFFVNLTTRTEGETCTEALVPYERRINLNIAGLPAGTYIVDINGRQLSFDIDQANEVNFEAGSDK